MTKLLLILAFLCTGALKPAAPESNAPNDGEYRIQIALLLDTSSSMDGLIEQAKAQLWKMVNTFATSKRNGKAPDIEISLYEYGKSTLSAESGYIRQIIPLSKDLDKVSEELFALHTNGGDEYCGWVIKHATENLAWSKSNDDLKVIIVAGNEPFNQGKVDFRESCKAAIKAGIIVNTIHCGDCQTGVREFWKEGADLADGDYNCIDTDAKVVNVPTPFDQQIIDLNGRLNKTYIGYGAMGKANAERQVKEDANAATLGAGNMSQRAASKSMEQYDNSSWDIVDAQKQDKDFAKKNAKSKDLPAELQNLSPEELEKAIEAKKVEREAIQKEILELNKKAEAYRGEELKKMGESATLDNVLNKSVKKQAAKKGYQFEN